MEFFNWSSISTSQIWQWSPPNYHLQSSVVRSIWSFCEMGNENYFLLLMYSFKNTSHMWLKMKNLIFEGPIQYLAASTGIRCGFLLIDDPVHKCAVIITQSNKFPINTSQVWQNTWSGLDAKTCNALKYRV